MNLNGQVLTRGAISDHGDPLERLAWLLEQTGRLEGGAMVFLGSPAPIVAARKGKLQVISDVGMLEATLL